MVLKQINSWYMVGFDHLKTSLTKNYSLDKILSIKGSKPQKIKLAFKEPYINQLINYPLSPYQTH